MGFYQDGIVPHLVHLALRNSNLLPYRERVTGAADGRVLEIGIGSCLNLPYYTHIETGYMKGPRPMTFLYEGRATPA